MPGTLNRIVVLGRSGSGKSSLARRLSEELDIPAFHIDFFGWQEGWKRAPFPAYRQQIERIADKKRWIIDGNSPRTFDLRFPRADAIIWLDLPPFQCLVRVISRTVRHFGRTRPTVAPGCPDRFSLLLFQRFFAFDKTVAPKIRLALDAYRAHAKTLVLTSSRDADLLGQDAIRERLFLLPPSSSNK